MPLHTNRFPLAHETPFALSPPSLLACGVCGHHTLADGVGTEFTHERSPRLVFETCGTHRVF